MRVDDLVMEAGIPGLTTLKAELRRTAQVRRAAAARDTPAAAALLCEALQALLRRPEVPAAPEAVVSGYWPIRSEIDPRPALSALAEAGHPLCLPVVAGSGRPLVFRAWRPGDGLVPGAFGAMVPAAASPVVVPRVLLVPLLAFDRRGRRLGYGGGFYDRTLAALRHGGAGEVLAIGLAFAAQQVGEVPSEATDEPLDWIVTEGGTLKVEVG